MRLTESHSSVQEEGVELLSSVLADRFGGRVRETIRITHDESIERIPRVQFAERKLGLRLRRRGRARRGNERAGVFGNDVIQRQVRSSYLFEQPLYLMLIMFLDMLGKKNI